MVICATQLADVVSAGNAQNPVSKAPNSGENSSAKVFEEVMAESAGIPADRSTDRLGSAEKAKSGDSTKSDTTGDFTVTEPPEGKTDVEAKGEDTQSVSIRKSMLQLVLPEEVYLLFLEAAGVENGYETHKGLPGISLKQIQEALEAMAFQVQDTELEKSIGAILLQLGVMNGTGNDTGDEQANAVIPLDCEVIVKPLETGQKEVTLSLFPREQVTEETVIPKITGETKGNEKPLDTELAASKNDFATINGSKRDTGVDVRDGSGSGDMMKHESSGHESEAADDRQVFAVKREDNQIVRDMPGGEGNDMHAWNLSGTANTTKGPEIVYRTEGSRLIGDEIISQVVEKATLILGDEKTEMLMSLKPDSLGKLSLKVVTENGIVTARFVAESQQVKQVLESNMQMLKDALEEQGINIQGFSVSVGDESSHEHSGGFDNMNDGKGARNVLRTAVVKRGVFMNTGDGNSLYGLSQSSIDLTA